MIKKVRDYVLGINQKYKDEAEDKYDFWDNHIKFVVQRSLELAEIYKADKELVEIGALLHDIALMSKVGTKADHHENGALIAVEFLTKLGLNQTKIDRIRNIILHHRSSKNAENIEETCVCDADILAHFDSANNIIINAKKRGKTPEDIRPWLMKDYNDLSEQTKERLGEDLKKKIDNICDTVAKSL